MSRPPTSPNTKESAMRLSRTIAPLAATSLPAALLLSFCSGSGSRAHEDVVPFEADLVGPQARRRIDRVRSGPHIVLPSMHGTGHDLAVESPLAHGPSAMQAHVGHGIEASLDVEEGDGMSLHDDDATVSGWDFGRLGHADEHGHPLRGARGLP